MLQLFLGDGTAIVVRIQAPTGGPFKGVEVPCEFRVDIRTQARGMHGD